MRALLAIFLAALAALPSAVVGMEITAIEPDGAGGIRLTWISEAGKNYRVDCSTDLQHWDPLMEVVGAEGGETSAPGVLGAGTSSFFRIVRLLPSVPSDLVLIPEGSFVMGDQTGELWYGRQDERPPHTVGVSAFYIGRHEVTHGLWEEVRTWGLTNGYGALPQGSFDRGRVRSRGDNHPVHSVSWMDCVRWCNARSEMEGLQPCYTCFCEGVEQTYRSNLQITIRCDFDANGYRLPTEAEWEKAARGGAEATVFPWGDSINHGFANYRANGEAYAYDSSPYSAYTYHPDYDYVDKPYTSAVGSFQPNGYGLHDVIGNVSEWCWDSWDNHYYEDSPESDPRGPAIWGTHHVVRGGSYHWIALHCRCAARSDTEVGLAYNQSGFRVARKLVE